MLILRTFLYFIGSLAIILTILPFLKFGAWWIRIGDFPRLQIALFCILVAAAFIGFAYPLKSFEIVFLISVAACGFYQIYCVLPYLPIYPKQVEKAISPKTENTIKLLISNVLIENNETEKLLDLVKNVNPDIVLLAEPDEKWMRGLSELDNDYPFSVKYPLDNAYGMALFSQLELIEPKLNFLIQDDIPSIFTGVRLRSDVLVNLYCLHPRPPFPTENIRSNERDAELILIGEIVKDTNTPTIIAGDLNDVAWSRTTELFQKISNMLDPRIGRGLFNSFHADHWFIRFPLDHVFHSNHFRLIEIKRLPSIGSDHFPIFIALSYEQTAEITQEEPDADADEEKEAIEIVEDVIK